MVDMINVCWPGWETVQLIGRGSYGAVYEIQRDVLGQVEKSALKVISIPQNDSDIEEMYNDGYDDESITSTFKSHLESIVAEYSLMRKMSDCVNIVNCDDIRYVQHDDGIGWDIFIKMELLTPLAKALPTEISEQTVIKLAKDICTALDTCKKHNIIHRDIKPQNIFVSENGDYKLGDFGIAKTVEKTMGGTKIGTYKYMAPEVYNNQPYGTAADIYSLGLVLYWMLNDRRLPFMPPASQKMTAGMEEEARRRRFAGEQIPAPKNGSSQLKSIVLKACAYDPAFRYKTPREMYDALQNIGKKPTPPPPTPKPAPPPPPRPPKPTPVPPPKPAPEVKASFAAVITTNEARRGCTKTFTFKNGVKKTVTIPANCTNGQVVDGVCIYVHDFSNQAKLSELPDAVVEMYANSSSGLIKGIIWAFIIWMIFGMATMQIPVMAGGLLVHIVLVFVVSLKKMKTINDAKEELRSRQRKK